jgi:predicted PurR-regulated permease PerM
MTAPQPPPPARRSRFEVPPALVVASDATWRSVVVVLGALALIWVVLELSVVTIPAFIALLATAVLQPPVLFLSRRNWPALAATWAVLAAAVAIVAGLVALLVPSFMDQGEELASQLDEGIAEVENWLATGPLSIENPDLLGAIDTLRERLLDTNPGAVIGGVTVAAEILAGALLALVMTFFFIKDGPKIVAWANGHLPPERRPGAGRAALAAWRSLSAYIRGTVVIGIVNGTVIGIGLAVLGVPLALPLGIITGLSAFFPLVGAVVAGALAALVALVSGGVVDALIVVALTVVVQQVEGDVLSPIVMGKALKLHPLVILVVLTVGAVTAGLLGAFLAVPLTGVVVSAVAAVRNDPVDTYSENDPHEVAARSAGEPPAPEASP